MPYDLIIPLLRGVNITLQLFFISVIFVFIIGFLAGLGRLSKFWVVRTLVTIYVEIFRGTSLLVQLFWAFFVLPFFGINFSPMVAGIIIFSLHYGAYVSEVVRSSILAIPKTQIEAATALNMTSSQILTHIIMPQAFLIMLPSFGNYMVEMLKGTALVSLITLSDLMFQGVKIYTTTLRTFDVFFLVLIIYFLLAYPITLCVRWLEGNLVKGRI